MNSKLWPLLMASLILLLQGCTERVLVAPRIDLKPHEVVGVIDFDCTGEGELGPFLTQRFVDAVRRDQGLVRMVMLGTETNVLADVGRSRLDREAFQEIGKKYEVQTVFTGTVEVSDVKPSVAVGQSFTYLGVSADVDATLATQMVETETGASLWSASAHDLQRIGGVQIFGNKGVTFDADDPENAYGRLADSLVYAVTGDFRSHWIRVRKKK